MKLGERIRQWIGGEKQTSRATEQQNGRAIDNLMLATQSIIDSIGATEGLGLQPEDTFFRERVAILLFPSCFTAYIEHYQTLVYSKPEQENIHKAHDFLKSRASIVWAIQLDPLPVKQLKRAFDYAASNLVNELNRHLQVRNQSLLFAEAFLSTIALGESSQREVHSGFSLFPLTPDTQSNLAWIFSRDKRDIDRFRQELSSAPSVPEPILTPA